MGKIPSLQQLARCTWLAVLLVPLIEGLGSADVASFGLPFSAEGTVQHLGCRSDGGSSSGSFRRFEGKPSRTEPQLFADAADGRWDAHTLAGAALVASGVERPEALHDYEARLAQYAAELKRSGAVSGTARQQAKRVFDFMHRRVLHGGYRLEATDLTVALDRGQYNCVSASVLFACLAESFGLDVCGLEAPGHAMCRLRLPQGSVDVETTCPEWFQLGKLPRKMAADPAKTHRATDSLGSREAAIREVSAVQLVAAIYYNRGVDLLGQERFAEALAANAKALRLDPANRIARGNFLAALNNWAIALGAGGRHAEAANLLAEGIALEPAYSTFRANYLHVHREWTRLLCKADRFREALNALAKGAEARAQESQFDGLRREIYRRWSRAEFEAGRAEDAFAVLAEARQTLGDRPDWLEAEAEEINRYALRLLDEGLVVEAIDALDRALGRLPEAKLLQENRRIAVMRWAAPAFREGDYAEAIHRTTHRAVAGRLDPALVNNVRYGYYHWISALLAGGRRGAAAQVARQARTDPFLEGRTAGAIPSAFLGLDGR